MTNIKYDKYKIWHYKCYVTSTRVDFIGDSEKQFQSKDEVEDWITQVQRKLEEEQKSTVKYHCVFHVKTKEMYTWDSRCKRKVMLR